REQRALELGAQRDEGPRSQATHEPAADDDPLDLDEIDRRRDRRAERQQRVGDDLRRELVPRLQRLLPDRAHELLAPARFHDLEQPRRPPGGERLARSRLHGYASRQSLDTSARAALAASPCEADDRVSYLAGGAGSPAAAKASASAASTEPGSPPWGVRRRASPTTAPA